MSDGKGFENPKCPSYRVHYIIAFPPPYFYYYNYIIKEAESLDFTAFS
jgi:hypothetical protein